MREFVKDYVELQKHGNVWMKKHWKGYLAFCVIGGVIYYAIWQLILNKELKQFEESISNTKSILYPTEES